MIKIDHLLNHGVMEGVTRYIPGLEDVFSLHMQNGGPRC